MPGLVEFVDANEPRLIAFESYLTDDGTEVANVFVHPDADSEDFHMQVAGDKVKGGYEFLDFTKMSIEVYGRPSDTVLDGLTQFAAAGTTVSIKAHHFGGFTRSNIG
jgi:hypothetical protein